MQEYNPKRVLLISDTHGDFERFVPRIKKLGEIDLVLHMGDVEHENDYIARQFKCPCLFVRGNCDAFSDLPKELTFKLGKYTALMTHGDAYKVKMSYQNLIYRAEELECNLAFFGHTHVRMVKDCNGITIVNPGSLKYSMAFGHLEYYIAEFDDEGNITFIES